MTHIIHPSAIIEDGAKIGNNVSIGAFCYVGANVVLDDGVCLHTHVVIDGRTHIGAGTEVFSFAVIGKRCQDLKFEGEDSALIIGKNNVIREHATMHPGTKGGHMKTVIGDNGLFMVGCHVAHDCIVGNHVIMANNATIAGHVTVGDHVIIGGLSAVHQFVRIGEHSIIGGMSGVESDIMPYARVKGERASLSGLNLIGLERRGFSKDDLKQLQRAYNMLFSNDGTLDDRIEQVAREFSDFQPAMDIIKFAREKTRFPLCQPAKRAA